MESPIPDRFWSVLLDITTATLTAAVTWSLYAQRRRTLNAHATEFAVIASPTASNEEVEAALELLRSRLTDEARGGGTTKVECWGRIPALMDRLSRSLKEEPPVPSIAEAVLRIVQRACSDAQGRCEFARSQCLQPLLLCLSDSYTNGQRTLLEESAQTLATLVRTADDSPIGEVPFGSEVTLQLVHHGAAPKLLRMMRADNPATLLQSMGSVVCSMALLKAGARIVAEGVDGQRGVTLLRPLLSHPNATILEQTLRTYAALARSGEGRDLDDPPLLRDVLSHLGNPQQVRPSMGVVYIVWCMLGAGQCDGFVRNVVATPGAVAGLIVQWCRSPEARARDLAEATVRKLERHPAAKAAVVAEMLAMKGAIAEREAQDEEQKRRMMKHNRQQIMLQQMMMMQGGGDDMD